MDNYDVVQAWGDELQAACSASGEDYVVDFLRSGDLTTPKGIKDLADAAIARLQNNLVSGVQDAKALWQASQCLKKFRYGCAATPEEMQQGWVERNAALEDVRLPWWLALDMRRLLAPLGPAFEATDADGRYGNGAVFEGWTVHARYLNSWRFTYNVRDPDRVWSYNRSPSDCARLDCVPKDMLKLRTITVEPAEATFIQQRTRIRLLQALQVLPRSSGLPAQLYGGGPEIQRERALRGSLDGNLATIDLSDASDSISMCDVADVFPVNVVAELEKARSQYVLKGQTRLRCHMFAGMGNATTFAVESAYFWALFTAICQRLRVFTPVSVFGDDIVLATRAARHPLFCEYARQAHVKLNMAKCGISDGPGFREACGLVAYQGEQLPLLRINGYSRNKPEELVSLCSLISEGLRPDSRYAPFVRTLMIEVGKGLLKDLNLPVLPEPLIAAGAYIVDPSETVGEWSYRARWNPKEQHPEVKVKTLVPSFVKEVRAKDLAWGERMGILNGQLHTTFNDARLGFRSGRRTVFAYPSKDMELRHSWVPCWSTDASLIELCSSD